MPLLYVAGPYRAETREGVELNIQIAKGVGLLAAKKGWAPVIPHMNTAHLDAIAPSLGDQFWLDATMELMVRCDAILLLPGWSRSSGTRAEYERAMSLSMDAYVSVDTLPTAEEFVSQMGIRKPGLVALQ